MLITYNKLLNYYERNIKKWKLEDFSVRKIGIITKYEKLENGSHEYDTKNTHLALTRNGNFDNIICLYTGTEYKKLDITNDGIGTNRIILTTNIYGLLVEHSGNNICEFKFKKYTFKEIIGLFEVINNEYIEKMKEADNEENKKMELTEEMKLMIKEEIEKKFEELRNNGGYTNDEIDKIANERIGTD